MPEREHNPEPDSSPPFRLPPSLPPSLPSPRPFPCRAATRYIRPVANLPICQLPGTLGRELWSKWDGEMLIAGRLYPPNHCHQGPSLSLMMTGLFDDDEWTFCPQWTSLPIPCLHHAYRVFFGNSARDPLGRWRRRRRMRRYCLG